MPPFPIKSEMASTSGAAAEGTDWELPLICLQSTESQIQLPVKIHYCEMRCIHKLRKGDIKEKFLLLILSSSVLLLFPVSSSFSSPFLLLLYPLFTILPRPLALVSVSVCSFAVGSQQTAESWQDEGSAWRWLMFKTRTHTYKHTSAVISIQKQQQLCLEWKWGRQAYRCWENPCVHLSSFAVSLSLFLTPSASLSTETATQRPLPFPVAPSND